MPRLVIWGQIWREWMWMCEVECVECVEVEVKVRVKVRVDE